METKKEDSLISWWTLIGIVTFMGVAWLIGYQIVYYNFYKPNAEHAGQLGDSINILTSFIGSLTVAGLFYTIMLQRKELHDAKIEFRKQNENLEKNGFQTTFFNMIASGKDNISVIKHPGANSGDVDIFRPIMKSFHKILESSGHVKGFDFEKKTFKEVCTLALYTMTPYIHTLDLIIELVENNTKDDKELEKFYLSIIGASFTRRQRQFLRSVSAYWDGEPKLINRLKKLLMETERFS